MTGIKQLLEKAGEIIWIIHVLKASIVECWSILLSTINWPLDQHSKDILVDKFRQYFLMDTWSIVGQGSTDQMFTEMSTRCRWSVDHVLIKGWSRVHVSIEGIDWHSTTDVFSSHDAIIRQKYNWPYKCKKSLTTSHW